MSKRRLSCALAAAALMSAVAGSAWAAGPAPQRPVDFTVRAEPAAAAPNTGQATRYDASKGRFGITMSLQQPAGREATPNDVTAGAFFRITPSVRVGGSVALGEQDLTPRRNQARPADQPKVRLETLFKF